LLIPVINGSTFLFQILELSVQAFLSALESGEPLHFAFKICPGKGLV
jgi:hypothetical protein